MATYRVIDMRKGMTGRELSVEADTPEQAGAIALKEKLMRSGNPLFWFAGCIGKLATAPT